MKIRIGVTTRVLTAVLLGLFLLSCAAGPEDSPVQAEAPREAPDGESENRPGNETEDRPETVPRRGDVYEVTARGRLVELGLTVWMYGTHGLVEPGTGEYLYALTSDSVDLDRYEGVEVTVWGNLVEGYPVDTGPPYLRVIEVEP